MWYPVLHPSNLWGSHLILRIHSSFILNPLFSTFLSVTYSALAIERLNRFTVCNEYSCVTGPHRYHPLAYPALLQSNCLKCGLRIFWRARGSNVGVRTRITGQPVCTSANIERTTHSLFAQPFRPIMSDCPIPICCTALRLRRLWLYISSVC